MLNKITCMLFDIEGTLTSKNGRGHSENLFRIIKKVIQKDIVVGLVTGRESAMSKAIHRIFDLNGPIISENGSELIFNFKDNERNVIYEGLKDDDKKTIINILKSKSILKDLYVDDQKKYMITLYLNNFPNHKIEELKMYYNRIQNIFKDYKNISITYSSAAIDINKTGIDKCYGINQFSKLKFIPLRNIVYIGDSYNDFSAFELIIKNGGLVCMVGDDSELINELNKIGNIGQNLIITNSKGPEGSVEFLKSILREDTMDSEIITQYNQCANDWRHFDTSIWQMPSFSVALSSVILLIIDKMQDPALKSLILFFGTMLSISMIIALNKHRLFQEQRTALLSKIEKSWIDNHKINNLTIRLTKDIKKINTIERLSAFKFLKICMIMTSIVMMIILIYNVYIIFPENNLKERHNIRLQTDSSAVHPDSSNTNKLNLFHSDSSISQSN